MFETQKVRRHDKFRKECKRPLFASRTRCNVLWKPPKFGNKVKIAIKVQFGNTFANGCNV